MAKYTPAYQRAAIIEGGYQRLTADRGNYNSNRQLVGTNWGIAAPVYEQYLGHPPTTAEMRSMQKSVAVGIFKRKFWDRIKGDQITNQFVAEIFFDGVVNHGVSNGTKLMQECLGVQQDGVLGPITLGKLNAAVPAEIYLKYKLRRLQYYVQIVLWRPSQKVFLRGWMRRILAFRDF